MVVTKKMHAQIHRRVHEFYGVPGGEKDCEWCRAKERIRELKEALAKAEEKAEQYRSDWEEVNNQLAAVQERERIATELATNTVHGVCRIAASMGLHHDTPLEEVEKSVRKLSAQEFVNWWIDNDLKYWSVADDRIQKWRKELTAADVKGE